MKAIIETGGKQYTVTEGAEIFVEKLEGAEKDKVTFDKVLMLDGKVGTPYVSGAKVTGEIVKQGKQKKIVVFKYRQKNNFHKTQGHRQPYTKVKITSIK
ncbi:MAG: 50S ribosomal protein L21 [Bacilli bacterium]|nr:50S ribosomal protein L21 [Bacilli bacterium]MBR3116933.1 50S ribosomal protein L21 [Bacilli bacterium]